MIFARLTLIAALELVSFLMTNPAAGVLGHCSHSNSGVWLITQISNLHIFVSRAPVVERLVALYLMNLTIVFQNVR